MSEPDWAPLTRLPGGGDLRPPFGRTVRAAAPPRGDRDRRRGHRDGAAARRRRTARAHRGVDRRAARHRGRHHRHRLSRLDRRGRRLGPGRRTDRRAVHGAGWSRADRRRPARCAPPACPRSGHRTRSPRARCCSTWSRAESRPAHRGAAARRHRRLGSVPRVPRRVARRRGARWCRSGCTAGTPLTSRRRLRPAGDAASPSRKFDAVSFTSAPAVAAMLMRAARTRRRGRRALRAARPACTRCAWAR